MLCVTCVLLFGTHVIMSSFPLPLSCPVTHVTWLCTGLFRFFERDESFPVDVDCIALGLRILLENSQIDNDTANNVLTRYVSALSSLLPPLSSSVSSVPLFYYHVSPSIQNNVAEDGVILVYFDDSRKRTDAVVCANVLLVFHMMNRLSDVTATVDWVLDHFKAR